jgi:hypothetical protein
VRVTATPKVGEEERGNQMHYVKQKLVEDNFLEAVISVLSLGLGGFILSEVHKRKAEKEARKRGCLCAFRKNVFPLPYSNEVVHVWRLYDRNNTGKYNIDTGHVFKITTGYLD